MHIYIGFPIAFLVVVANSPIFALIGGIFFMTALSPPKNFIPHATGANLLKTGIVILGLTISSSTVSSLTSSYFFYISAYVLAVFFVGILLARIFRIDFKLVQERIILRSKQEQRSDDNIDVIKTRLDKYTKETYPVSQFFSKNFDQNFFTIDASQEVSKIQKELINIIKKGQK